MAKRVFDTICAFVMLSILFVPVFLPLWLLIRLTSKGGAIFGQTRVGKGCKPFTLYKFRSMYVGSDAQGYQTKDDDKRITPVGHFIRRTSLDELPQLINLLKGDMSLVGPRPDTPMQEQNYTPEDWILRHSVRPGITGLAQANGRSSLSKEERLAYDLEYAKKFNLLLDLSILVKTLRVAVGKSTN